MTWTVANKQFSSIAGTGGAHDAIIDCTHLLANDFVVIALKSRSGGGGYTWFNKFAGSASFFNHTTGPFGDSTDVFGHLDATLVSDGLLGALYRHKVTTADLTDTAGGNGALTKLGWGNGTVPGGTSITVGMWTIRGATYASATTTSGTKTPPASPDTITLTQGTLTSKKAYFNLACEESGGVLPPTDYPETVGDNTGAAFVHDHNFAAYWLYAGGIASNNGAVNLSSAFGAGPDPTTVVYSYTNSGDPNAGLYATAASAVVVFNEDYGGAGDHWAWAEETLDSWAWG